MVDDFLNLCQYMTIYTYRKVQQISPFFYIICTECQYEERFHFLLGDLVNIEGDLILLEIDQINLSHRTCQNFYNSGRSCMMGSVFVKRSKLKIKNILPKDKKILIYCALIQTLKGSFLHLYVYGCKMTKLVPPHPKYLLQALPTMVMIVNDLFLVCSKKKDSDYCLSLHSAKIQRYQSQFLY